MTNQEAIEKLKDMERVDNLQKLNKYEVWEKIDKKIKPMLRRNQKGKDKSLVF